MARGFQDFEVKTYRVSLYQGKFENHKGTTFKYRGIIECDYEGKTGSGELCIVGLTEDSNVPEKMDLPAIFIPFNEMGIFLDMLRNEKPVYAHIDNNNPINSFLSTSSEPIGEGEDETNILRRLSR